LTPLVRGWLATTPQFVPVRAQIVCGPAPEPQTSLLSVYPLLVQLSHCPVATQTASEGTPELGDPVGDVVGVDVAGDVVGLVTVPVQAVPFSVKLVGTGLLPVHDPLNPNEAVPSVAIDPL
jgi:hypothetical protein